MAIKITKSFLLLLIFCTFSLLSCKTGSKTTIEKIIATQRAIMPADSIIQKQKKGIDLIASGNNPVNWYLEIDFDKILNFKSADGNNLNILPSFSKKEINADAETYSTQTDLGQLTIKVFNLSCTGNETSLNKKTEVHINTTVYSGCANYLYNHQLNDIWVLETVNNVKQHPRDFNKGIPYLEFNLQENKMTGSDGCKNISSAMEVKGNRIKFSAFALSKVTCSKNIVEKIFSEMLSDKQVDYFMENGKLILYLSDDSKLGFKRKDL